MSRFTQRALLSWIAVGVLALLCGVLGILQYRWIGEITGAERGRLRESLRSRMSVLRRSFNGEVENACSLLVPSSAEIERLGREGAYAARYAQWRKSHPQRL